MKIENLLVSLWFSENEIKVYISLLKSGWNYVSNLSKDTEIERVSLYYTLENLTKKWLIYPLNKNKMKFFTPEKPEKIINIQKERLNTAESILPELKLLENTNLHKPVFKFYEGIKWVEEVLSEVFEYKEIKSYANLINSMEYKKDLVDRYFHKIIEEKSTFNIILPYKEETIKYIKNINKKNNWNKINYVFINAKEFPFQYDVFITEKIVWIISITNGEIVAIRIESKAYAGSQKAIFDLAWLGATSFAI